ncbi:hypothetical protein [Streptomyces sp.]|nr:hypothetical protein [Streptomyces sp.]
MVNAPAVHSGTQSPGPPRSTSVARRVRPAWPVQPAERGPCV